MGVFRLARSQFWSILEWLWIPRPIRLSRHGRSRRFHWERHGGNNVSCWPSLSMYIIYQSGRVSVLGACHRGVKFKWDRLASLVRPKRCTKTQILKFRLNAPTPFATLPFLASISATPHRSVPLQRHLHDVFGSFATKSSKITSALAQGKLNIPHKKPSL